PSPSKCKKKNVFHRCPNLPWESNSMHPFPRRACGLAFAVFFLIAGSVWAETPPDPLRLIPEEADFVIKIDHPRRLVDMVLNLDVLKPVREFQAVKDVTARNNARRFFQLVAYFEKESGVKWPEMLDRLAGGGVVLAGKVGQDHTPVGLVVQGKDEKLLQRFLELGCTVVEGELARQESKDRLQKMTYRNHETIHVGKEFHAAAVGSALVIANSDEGLHRVIDLHLDGKKNLTGVPSLAEARNLLPPHPLVWMWLNMEAVRQTPQAKEVFAQPRNDP